MITIPETCFSDKVAYDLRKASPEKLALCLQLGWHVYHNTKTTQLLTTEPVTTSSSSSSATIGTLGEDYVENILKETFQIKNVTKKGHAGDLIASRSNIDLMVEIKNYTYPVPSAEVDKFYRDLRSNSSVQGGVFISLNTRITGVEETMQLTQIYENRKIPIIFLKSSDPGVIAAAAEILHTHLQTITNMRTEFQTLGQESYAKIYQKVKTISTLLDGLGYARVHLNETRDILLKQLNRLHEDILSTEVRVQDAVNSLLGSLRPVNPPDIEMVETVKLLERFRAVLAREFAESCILKDKNHGGAVEKLLNDTFKGTESVKITTQSGKNISLQSGVKQLLISPLKTKTNVAVPVSEGDRTLTIPRTAKYDDGWIMFSIDRNFLKTGGFEDLQSFIAH